MNYYSGIAALGPAAKDHAFVTTDRMRCAATIVREPPKGLAN
jgi:hypothetical protein